MDITSYIMGSIAGAKSASGLKYLVVDELPETGADNTIYLVPKSTSKTNNYYDEYMYINNKWEIIGDTEIDLSNYQTLLTSSNKLNADYIDDTNTTNKLTNATEKSAWNNKYDKPSGGIPDTDLSSAVQTSLGKADTAIQDISGKQDVIDSTHKLNADLVDDTTSTNKFFSGNYNDLSNKPTIPDVVQYSTLPTASASNEGKIAQYIGTTDSTYTNGYFYKCVSDGQDPATYSWENIEVQASGSSGASYIEDGTGAKMYIAKYTTDNTYNTNVLRPILQEMFNDYRTNSSKSNLSVFIDDSSNLSNQPTYETVSNRTGIYKISYFWSYMQQVTFSRMSDDVYQETISSGTYKGTKKIAKINSYFVCTVSNNLINSNPNWVISTDNDKSYVLASNNTSYTFVPTLDNHPANKKYVDDSIASAIGTALQGSY